MSGAAEGGAGRGWNMPVGVQGVEDECQGRLACRRKVFVTPRKQDRLGALMWTMWGNAMFIIACAWNAWPENAVGVLLNVSVVVVTPALAALYHVPACKSLSLSRRVQKARM